MISNVSKPLAQGFTENRPALGASLAARSIQSALLALRMIGYRINCYFLSHPCFFKHVFAVLRSVRPLALFGNILVVTKAADVREVLERFEDFALGDFIAPGMPWGSFLHDGRLARPARCRKAITRERCHPGIRRRDDKGNRRRAMPEQIEAAAWTDRRGGRPVRACRCQHCVAVFWRYPAGRVRTQHGKGHA